MDIEMQVAFTNRLDSRDNSTEVSDVMRIFGLEYNFYGRTEDFLFSEMLQDPLPQLLLNKHIRIFSYLVAIYPFHSKKQLLLDLWFKRERQIEPTTITASAKFVRFESRRDLNGNVENGLILEWWDTKTLPGRHSRFKTLAANSAAKHIWKFGNRKFF